MEQERFVFVIEHSALVCTVARVVCVYRDRRGGIPAKGVAGGTTIFVRFLDIFISLSAQPVKAPFSILVTESGIVTLSSFLHVEKHSEGIVSSPSEITALVSFAQSLNAPSLCFTDVRNCYVNELRSAVESVLTYSFKSVREIDVGNARALERIGGDFLYG